MSAKRLRINDEICIPQQHKRAMSHNVAKPYMIRLYNNLNGIEHGMSVLERDIRQRLKHGESSGAITKKINSLI
jgi:hypothetical protein